MRPQLASCLTAIVLALTAVCLPSRGLATAGAPWLYPATKTVDAADVHFGRTYPDPFLWLEDRKDAETDTWFRTQSALADSLLDRIPGRERLVAEWAALDKLSAATYADLTVRSGQVFYKKTLGGENVGKLYVRDGWSGTERPLFDPATYNPGVVGWNDPRVEPWETAKFIAALQTRAAPGRPALLKVNYDNGHETEDKAFTFRDFASQMAFLLWQAGHPDFQPAP